MTHPNAGPAPDPRLKEFATPRQIEYIDAVTEHGSHALAAAALGINKSAIGEGLRAVEKKAARNGYAPNHFEGGVAPGYLMGKVTVQRGPAGVERTWERQSPDAQAVQEAMRAAVDALKEELVRLAPIPRPAGTMNALLNLYTLTDCHVGMLAWRKEGGEDWDLKIAEKVLSGCFEQMVEQAPPAEFCVVNQLGDFLHYDGLMPVTPTSGHIVDAEGRFSKMVGAAIRILRRIVDLALLKHETVFVVMAEGNHDLASSVWLRLMFKALYEDEPRVVVIDSELPYYALVHGKTMLGFHHGHLKKPSQFASVFAAQFPEMWGATKYRYAHAGHMHHLHEKEDFGMTVTQHRTLAARDAYAARGAWFANRSATAITYHREYGEVARTTICPEMLEE